MGPQARNFQAPKKVYSGEEPDTPVVRPWFTMMSEHPRLRVVLGGSRAPVGELELPYPTVEFQLRLIGFSSRSSETDHSSQTSVISALELRGRKKYFAGMQPMERNELYSLVRESRASPSSCFGFARRMRAPWRWCAELDLTWRGVA